MKKSLLLASVAFIGLSAAAQGVDPATYATTAGYQLTNKWLMSVGDGSNGVALDDWNALAARFANAGKATTATMLDGKIYIACSQNYYDGVNPDTGEPARLLDHLGHLVVIDAETGKFVKDLALTLNGEPLNDLLCVNQVGTDDFGHVWVCGYVGNCYDPTTGTARPMNLYLVDTETGALTLVNAFQFDELEGPSAGGRIDYYDVMGDIVGNEAGASFMAIPNEVAKAYIWCKYGDSWEAGPEGYVVITMAATYPENQGAWNYSPMGAFVKDGENYESAYFWIDGHTTCPSLYDNTGELISSFATHAADANDETPGPWHDFIPERQPNGMRQFKLGDSEFLAYAIEFPDDKNMGGGMAIVKLDGNLGLEGTETDPAEPLFIAPAAKLGIKKGEGRFSHSIVVGPEKTDANGKKAIDIMLYKDMNGVGVYTLAEEGYQNGINDITTDVDANAPVEYFNLNGVRMQGELTPGLYISRQGTKATKVIVK